MPKETRTTIHKVNGDCVTPIVLFNRLQGTQKFLLESAAKHEDTGRYSFIGANPRKIYQGKGQTLQEISDVTYTHEGDMIHSLKQMMPRISQDTQYPFMGGALGYIQGDEVLFQVYDTVIIFDHMTEELAIVHTNIEVEQQTPNIEALIQQITSSPIVEEQQPTFTDYRRFRVEQRAAYLYYVEFPNTTFIGSSPSSILRVQNGRVSTPLATVNQWLHEEQLPPASHPIDALAEAAKCVPSMLGYIGFNGQLDFTVKG